VDHRVEPATWLTDGSTEGAPATPESAPEDPKPVLSNPADGAEPLPDLPMPSGSYHPPAKEMPYTGQYSAGHDMPYSPASQEAPGNGDGLRIPPYQPQVPPLPAHQVTPPPAQDLMAPGTPAAGSASMASMAAKVTAPFAALTKTKTKKADRPDKPSKVRPTVKPPPAADRTTAPVTRPAPAPVPVPVPVPAPAASRPSPATASTRRAQLVLARVEPWSVMKFSFMISLVGWVILFVAVAALYYVLNKLGVFHSVQSTITDVTSGKGTPGADSSGQWFSASRILGYTMLVGAVNVVLITALATVGAVIYNLVTHLAGGIEVTLKETD
jgi:Transmembrane domain of unknown function (DUF3566)